MDKNCIWSLVWIAKYDSIHAHKLKDAGIGHHTMLRALHPCSKDTVSMHPDCSWYNMVGGWVDFWYVQSGQAEAWEIVAAYTAGIYGSNLEVNRVPYLGWAGRSVSVTKRSHWLRIMSPHEHWSITEARRINSQSSGCHLFHSRLMNINGGLWILRLQFTSVASLSDKGNRFPT